MSRRANRRKPLTDAQREQRRDEDRQRMQAAAAALLTSDGWQRWIRVRSQNGLARYSANNLMLIAWQCEERGLDPTYVAAFRKWNELGRAVRRGERALSILAPMPLRNRDTDEKKDRGGRDGDGRDQDKPRVLFRRASVFDVSQTDPIPGADPAPLQPPAQPICGSSHEHLIVPLCEHASTLGYRVEFNEIPSGGPSGWCDYTDRVVVVAAQLPANAQVRVLVHELAHAHGISKTDYTRAQAEVLVECVTHIVLSTAGLDTRGESVPYIAGWGEKGALEAITTYARVIDETARAIEHAIAGTQLADEPQGELVTAA